MGDCFSLSLSITKDWSIRLAFDSENIVITIDEDDASVGIPLNDREMKAFVGMLEMARKAKFDEHGPDE